MTWIWCVHFLTACKTQIAIHSCHIDLARWHDRCGKRLLCESFFITCNCNMDTINVNNPFHKKFSTFLLTLHLRVLFCIRYLIPYPLSTTSNSMQFESVFLKWWTQMGIGSSLPLKKTGALLKHQTCLSSEYMFCMHDTSFVMLTNRCFQWKLYKVTKHYLCIFKN